MGERATGWLSSRKDTVVQPVQAEISGDADGPAAGKLRDAPEAEYQIVLKMDDMTPFIEKHADFHEQDALLEMRRSKLKLRPSSSI